MSWLSGVKLWLTNNKRLQVNTKSGIIFKARPQDSTLVLTWYWMDRGKSSDKVALVLQKNPPKKYFWTSRYISDYISCDNRKRKTPTQVDLHPYSSTLKYKQHDCNRCCFSSLEFISLWFRRIGGCKGNQNTYHRLVVIWLS